MRLRVLRYLCERLPFQIPDSLAIGILELYVGVGSSRYLFAVSTPTDGIDGATVVEPHYPRALYSEFQSATHRLATAPEYIEGQDCLGDLVARYWPRMRSAFERAADQVLDVAHRHPQPVLILENLGPLAPPP